MAQPVARSLGHEVYGHLRASAGPRTGPPVPQARAEPSAARYNASVAWDQATAIIVSVILAVLAGTFYNNRRMDEVNRRFDDVHRRIDDLRADTSRQLADLRQELQLTRQELKEEMRETRALLQDLLKAQASTS